MTVAYSRCTYRFVCLFVFSIFICLFIIMALEASVCQTVYFFPKQLYMDTFTAKIRDPWVTGTSLRLILDILLLPRVKAILWIDGSSFRAISPSGSCLDISYTEALWTCSLHHCSILLVVQRRKLGGPHLPADPGPFTLSSDLCFCRVNSSACSSSVWTQ